MILAVRDTLKAVGLPTDGPALIVSSPDAGPLSFALAERIESALKTAGTRSVDRLNLPENMTHGERIVAERLSGKPRIVQVFAVDNRAVLADPGSLHDDQNAG